MPPPDRSPAARRSARDPRSTRAGCRDRVPHGRTEAQLCQPTPFETNSEAAPRCVRPSSAAIRNQPGVRAIWGVIERHRTRQFWRRLVRRDDDRHPRRRPHRDRSGEQSGGRPPEAEPDPAQRRGRRAGSAARRPQERHGASRTTSPATSCVAKKSTAADTRSGCSVKPRARLNIVDAIDGAAPRHHVVVFLDLHFETGSLGGSPFGADGRPVREAEPAKDGRGCRGHDLRITRSHRQILAMPRRPAHRRRAYAERMLIGIDHLVIAVADPDAAADELSETLGIAAGGGGRHDTLGTYNRLIWLGDTYLELIAVFDRTIAATSWVGAPTLRALEDGGGLATWAIATDCHRRRRRPASRRRFGHRRGGRGRAAAAGWNASSVGASPRRRGSPRTCRRSSSSTTRLLPSGRQPNARPAPPRRLSLRSSSLRWTPFSRRSPRSFERPAFGSVRHSSVAERATPTSGVNSSAFARDGPQTVRSHGSRPDGRRNHSPIRSVWHPLADHAGRTDTLLTVSRAAAPCRRAESSPVALHRRGRRSRHACLRASRGRRSASGACRGPGRPCRGPAS